MARIAPVFTSITMHCTDLALFTARHSRMAFSTTPWMVLSTVRRRVNPGWGGM